MQNEALPCAAEPYVANDVTAVIDPRQQGAGGASSGRIDSGEGAVVQDEAATCSFNGCSHEIIPNNLPAVIDPRRQSGASSRHTVNGGGAVVEEEAAVDVIHADELS